MKGGVLGSFCYSHGFGGPGKVKGTRVGLIGGAAAHWGICMAHLVFATCNVFKKVRSQHLPPFVRGA